MSETHHHLAERTAASQALLAATRRATESLSSFSGWLMAGFGAAFSLIIANVETVSKFVSLPHLKCALLLFLASLVIAVVVRLFGAMVGAGVASHEDGESIGIKLGASGEPFDISLFIAEFQRGLLPPYRWIAARSMARARSGDTAAGARTIAKLSQLQALLVLLQAAVAIAAAVTFVLGLQVK